MTIIEQFDKELKELEKGCGNKVDFNGDCLYISSQGNKRYCSKCTDKIKKITFILKSLKTQREEIIKDKINEQ